MPGPTPIDYAALGASVLGSGGSAYLQSVDAANALRYAKKKDARDFAENLRRFNLGEARDVRQEPMARLGLSEQLRQALTAPTHYDFLSSMASRYGGG